MPRWPACCTSCVQPLPLPLPTAERRQAAPDADGSSRCCAPPAALCQAPCRSPALCGCRERPRPTTRVPVGREGQSTENRAERDSKNKRTVSNSNPKLLAQITTN